MQTDTTLYPQLASHGLVELQLTTRKLPESQIATQKLLCPISKTDNLLIAFQNHLLIKIAPDIVLVLLQLILTDNQCNDLIQLCGITLQNIRKVYQDLWPPITQAYSEPCVTLAYSKFGYIQNLGIFKTRGIFRTLVYAKLWHI